MKIKLLCERYVDAFISCYDKDSKVNALESLVPFIDKFDTDPIFKKILLSSSIKFEQKIGYVSKEFDFKDNLLRNFIGLILKKERSVVFTEMKSILIDKILTKISKKIIINISLAFGLIFIFMSSKYPTKKRLVLIKKYS